MYRVSRVLALACLCSTASVLPAFAAPDLNALQQLGKQVFFDKISEPERQACVSCHVPANGWTGGVSGTNLHTVAIKGANPHTVGNRKPPSNAYTTFSPRFGQSALGDALGATCTDLNPATAFGGACAGGMFWDGRAEGGQIGTEVFANNASLQTAYQRFLGPVADQALGPFPNDAEQNVPDGDDNGLPGAQAVCLHVQSARYAPLFERAWGTPIDCANGNAALSFKRIAVALSAWQASSEVNSFSSKRDLALASDTDHRFPLKGFTAQENLGHDLFYGKANCSICHNDGAPDSQGNEPKQLYTDFGYHNLGLPANYEIGSFDPNNPDFGLSRHTNPSNPSATGHAGFFKTPTLRNVDKRKGAGFTKAYMHNGYFKSLEDVVHFYNTSRVKLDPVTCPAGTTAAQARARDCWPAPEVPAGPLQASTSLEDGGPDLLGDLKLSAAEEAALVAYLRTLSDTLDVKQPQPYRP